MVQSSPACINYKWDSWTKVLPDDSVAEYLRFAMEPLSVLKITATEVWGTVQATSDTLFARNVSVKSIDDLIEVQKARLYQQLAQFLDAKASIVSDIVKVILDAMKEALAVTVPQRLVAIQHIRRAIYLLEPVYHASKVSRISSSEVKSGKEEVAEARDALVPESHVDANVLHSVLTLVDKLTLIDLSFQASVSDLLKLAESDSSSDEEAMEAALNGLRQSEAALVDISTIPLANQYQIVSREHDRLDTVYRVLSGISGSIPEVVQDINSYAATSARVLDAIVSWAESFIADPATDSEAVTAALTELASSANPEWAYLKAKNLVEGICSRERLVSGQSVPVPNAQTPDLEAEKQQVSILLAGESVAL